MDRIDYSVKYYKCFQLGARVLDKVQICYYGLRVRLMMNSN